MKNLLTRAWLPAESLCTPWSSEHHLSFSFSAAAWHLIWSLYPPVTHPPKTQNPKQTCNQKTFVPNSNKRTTHNVLHLHSKFAQRTCSAVIYAWDSTTINVHMWAPCADPDLGHHCQMSKQRGRNRWEREAGGGGLERNLEAQLSFWRLKSVCQDTNRRGGRRS